MKFTYFKKTGENFREVNGEQEWDGDEGYDFDYEAEYSEVESALQNIIYDEFFSDITKNEEIRKKIQSRIGEQLYNSYMTNISSKVEAKQKAEEKTQQEEADKRILEGKDYISYEGSQYKIKSQLNENSNEIGHNRDFTKQLKEKFGTANPYDSKIPNGTVLTIKCDSKGKNEFNYEDFGLVDVTDWRNWVPGYNIYNQITKWGNFNTRYVVYYNGNWYSADKK